jgi:hypothetical protein
VRRGWCIGSSPACNALSANRGGPVGRVAVKQRTVNKTSTPTANQHNPRCTSASAISFPHHRIVLLLPCYKSELEAVAVSWCGLAEPQLDGRASEIGFIRVTKHAPAARWGLRGRCCAHRRAASRREAARAPLAAFAARTDDSPPLPTLAPAAPHTATGWRLYQAPTGQPAAAVVTSSSHEQPCGGEGGQLLLPAQL